MYRLDCPCGGHAIISTSQAGGTTSCPACGQGLAIPKLGDLRELPEALTPGKPLDSTADWSSSRGSWFGLLAIVTILFGAITTYFGVKLTTTPPGKDRQTITAEIDEATHEMGPTDLLKMLQMYEQAGLDPRIPPESYRNLTNRRRYLTFLAVFGGLTLMSGLAAYRVARSR